MSRLRQLCSQGTCLWVCVAIGDVNCCWSGCPDVEGIRATCWKVSIQLFSSAHLLTMAGQLTAYFHMWTRNPYLSSLLCAVIEYRMLISLVKKMLTNCQFVWPVVGFVSNCIQECLQRTEKPLCSFLLFSVVILTDLNHSYVANTVIIDCCLF